MNLPKENTGYHKLTLFQKAKDLVLLVYKLTKNYPRELQNLLTKVLKLLYTYKKSLERRGNRIEE
jgi:hypothetical protein